ncbi:hypothetical protein [Dialister succinatiphilus]|uniref:hypothetical protein n=1 Tax=Dialister succinatiphilus TaxID=487173 RepID=UPI004027BC80
MAIQRRWILPLGALAAVGLTLWGIYGVGTAGTLLPEKRAASSPVEVLPEEEDGLSMKYDAALHRRGKPLQDPFHADALVPVEKGRPPLPVVEGREEAPAGKAPGLKKKETSSASGLPVLKGVMAYGSQRRALLEIDGTSIVVKEGERAGPWDVSDIQDKKVTLVSGGNSLTLTIR